MLFYSNRGARRARASSLLLPGLWVSLILASVSANMPANQCPNQIDCTIMRRHLCKLGSSHCGPCLFPFEEDGAGLCVPRLRRHLQHHLQDKQTSIPNVDEEIDYLSSIMAKQEAAEVRRPDLRLQVSPPSQSNTTTPSSVKATTAGPPTQETSDASQPHSKVSDRHGPIVSPHSSGHNLLVLMVSFCILVGTLVLVLLGVCWVRFQRESHLAQKVDYPAFPAAPPVNNQAPSGDNTLAHSAQMYHYQHQKQQMLSMEKQKTQPSVSESGATSDEENEEGDFTVYECPGLAPTGEMEVKNPLFDDSTDSTRNLK